MTARRRSPSIGNGLLGLSVAAGLFFVSGCSESPRPGTSETKVGAAPAPAKIDETSPLAVLADGIRRSDELALAALTHKLDDKVEGKPNALSAAEAKEWVEVVSSLRAGFLTFKGAVGRGAALTCSVRILEKFAAEPAPATWNQTLVPIRDLLATGLSDPDGDVRVASLLAIARIWNFSPGRSMLEIEEKDLGAWKDAFHPLVKRRLDAADPRIRAAAVACLGAVPIDAMAAPAAVYIDDPSSGEVRHQVLVAFARRTNLLTEDMIIKRLHDSEPGVPELAELVLRTRGLTRDQIALGRLISSPKPEMRAAVIPLLKEREDLDPVVWLLRLSQDDDDIVRAKAAEAMSGKDSAELKQRLREMASKDKSPAVRAAAGKLIANSGPAETAAALPPLPGSPSLIPKAN